MKKLIHLISLVFLLSILVSCDSRNSEKPTMSVSIDKAKIYYPQFSEIDGVTYHEATLMVSLDGLDSQTKNVYLDLTYDEEVIGIITNTGSNTALKTDNSGMVSATIISRSAGVANINVKVRNWSVNANRTLTVSLPEIVQISATPTSVPADSIAFSQISAKMMPPLTGKYMLYSTSLGHLESDSTATNSSAYSTNKIVSNVTGQAIVTVKLKDYPTQQKTINVEFVAGKK